MASLLPQLSGRARGLFWDKNRRVCQHGQDLHTAIRETVHGEQSKPFFDWLILFQNFVEARSLIPSSARHYQVFEALLASMQDRPPALTKRTAKPNSPQLCLISRVLTFSANVSSFVDSESFRQALAPTENGCEQTVFFAACYRWRAHKSFAS